MTGRVLIRAASATPARRRPAESGRAVMPGLPAAWRGSDWSPEIMSVVTSESSQASRSWRILSAGPSGDIFWISSTGSWSLPRPSCRRGRDPDLGDLAFVTDANRDVGVEVLAAVRAHAAEAQGVERSHHVDRGLDVVVNDERDHRRDRELVGAAAGAGTGEPFRQRVGVELLVRAQQHPRPAVAQLSGQRHVLRAPRRRETRGRPREEGGSRPSTACRDQPPPGRLAVGAHSAGHRW